MSPSVRGYDAFISFNTESDTALALRLRLALQRFGRPWYRRRLLRVFCAPADLEANPGLWSSLERALESSSHLVLLASPQAAASPWVGREVGWWLTHRSPDTLLIAITRGEIRWLAEENGFESGEGSALPATLSGVFAEEPHWVDLRGTGDDEGLFLDRVATLAAAISDKLKSDLIGEDLRQQRQKVRVAWSVAAVTVVLALAATGFGMLARAQQERAEQQSRIATSRYLAGQAEAQARGNPQLAMLLSAAALDTEPTVEARAAILAQAGRWRNINAFLSDPANTKINHMSLSPDGKTLATAMDDGRVVLWDTADRSRRLTVDSGIPNPESVVFVEEGRRFVVAGASAGLGVWQTEDGANVRRLTIEGYKVDLSSAATDGGFLLAVGDVEGRVVVWDLEGGEALWLLKAHRAQVNGLAFSPASSYLATAGADGLVKLWEPGDETVLTKPTITLENPTQPVWTPLAFSSDGELLAAGSYDGVGRTTVWNLESREVLHRLRGHYAQIRALTFVGERQRLLASTGSDQRLLLWDLDDGRRSEAYQAHIAPVTALASGKDPRILYSAAQDGNVIEWDLLGDQLGIHEDGARAVALRSDGEKIITGGSDGRILILSRTDPEDRAEVTVPSRAAVTDIAVSGDGERVAVATREEVWLTDDQGIGSVLPGSPEKVSSVAFSPDGRTLAAASNTEGVVVWDTAARTPTTLSDKSAAYDSIAFSPDGKLLAAGSHELSITLWDAAIHRVVGELTGAFNTVTGLAFAPDSRTLASVSIDNRVTFWNVAKRSATHVLTGHPIAASRAVFTPDGRILITGDLEGNIILWDAAQGLRLALLSTGRDAVYDLAVSPDGRRLYAAYGDGRVLDWIIDVPEALEHLCTIAGRSLTADERSRYLVGPSAATRCP